MRHILLGDGDTDAERVYRWHIEKRTGGREPRGQKTSLDDYVLACRDLVASMAVRGFQPAHPIRLGNNDALMDGAHRTASALLLGERVACVTADKPGHAAPWGLDWLAVNGASQGDIARIVADWNFLHGQEGSRGHAPLAGACAGMDAGFR